MPRKLSLVCAAMLLLPAAAFGQRDLDTNAFDTNVRVQDDLFQHVNGTWLKNTKIPSDKSNYGSFTKLADLSQTRIKKLIEEICADPHEKGTLPQKVGDFYNSFMDIEAINSRGIAPIQNELDLVSNLKTKQEIFAFFGKAQKMGVGSPVAFFVMQDAKDSTRYMVQLIQAGTTLPDRDYYLKDDDKSHSAREALQIYIQTLLELAGDDDAKSAAAEIVQLETELAKIQWERVKLRDAEKRYNKKTLGELSRMTESFDWSAFFVGTDVADFEDVNVWTPSFFEGLESVFDNTSEATWVDYLKYKIIDGYAPYLSKPFVDANFELYQTQLAGVPEMKPRWKRGVELVAGAGTGFGALGDAIGELYVAKYFKPEAKEAMDKLVKNLLKSFELSIDELAWMTDETKVRAKEKLSKIDTKIGYTSKWRDYSDLNVDASDLIANVRSSGSVEYYRNIRKLGKPIDRTEWGMTPQTVNAYYNPAKNEIVFPAAILQSPFFSFNAEDALNYGGIGAVIGHEISHAFDDQGSKFDGDGNMKNWWTDKDRDAFKDLTTRLIAQYAGYEPLDGKMVNGQLTLGENIADLSGLTIAHKAFKISRNGVEPEKIAGWSSDQLFFVGWSRVWARKYRDAEMVKRLLMDPHSPSQYRANGPVMNIDAFQNAFNLKEGDRLFKPKSERIKIW